MLPDAIEKISLSDELSKQKEQSTQQLRFDIESLIPLGLSGLLLGLVAVVIAKVCWDVNIGIIVGMGTGMGLGVGSALLISHRQRSSISAQERRWHEQLIALPNEVDDFNERLEAFRALANTFEGGHGVDPTITAKYASDRKALDLKMRLFVRDIALKRFEHVLAKNAPTRDAHGTYRVTQDVSDMVFVHRVRAAREEAEIAALTAASESPNEAQFRELEAREQAAFAREEQEPEQTMQERECVREEEAAPPSVRRLFRSKDTAG